MPNYYFDLETDTEDRTRPDPTKDKIVSICYQPVYDDSGNAKGPMVILRAWKTSEVQILQQFLEMTGWLDKNPSPWQFIPVGFNLSYDLTILIHRSSALLEKKLSWAFLFSQLPKVDLKTLIVLANKGKFKGSSLDNFSQKKSSGKKAYEHIQDKNWLELINYIETETVAFLELYQYLLDNLPQFIQKFIQDFDK